MKKSLVFFLLFMRLSLFCFAGDVASFVNLGFSNDSKYYMFGQFGLTEKESYPYTELFIVDVKSNSFVRGGVFKQTYKISTLPGQDGSGALYTLLHSQAQGVSKYKINHLNTGRTVYLLLNGEEAEETINFRDFQTGKIYDVTLSQSLTGTGKDRSSSFSISVRITESSGAKKTYTVGLPDFRRPGVLAYRIKQVIVTPDEKALVFVVEREEIDTQGVNIRYMIESLMF